MKPGKVLVGREQGGLRGIDKAENAESSQDETGGSGRRRKRMLQREGDNVSVVEWFRVLRCCVKKSYGGCRGDCISNKYKTILDRFQSELWFG